MGQCYCYVSNNSPFAPPRYTAVLTLRVGIIKQFFFPTKFLTLMAKLLLFFQCDTIK